MPRQFGLLAAVFGSALTALSLSGSFRAPANAPDTDHADPAALAEINKHYASGKELYRAGRYLEAREAFLSTASLAERAGATRLATESHINAGVASYTRQDARHALPELLRARQMAEAQHDPDLIAITLNNLAGLYLGSGHPDEALRTAAEALRGAASLKDSRIRPKLQVQLATALSRLNRINEAAAIYRQAVDQLIDQGDLNTAVRVLAMFGGDAIEANRLDLAEAVLDEALWMIRMHHLPESSNVLRGLANVRYRTGDPGSAVILFDGAVRAPLMSTTPAWKVYADRGEFRLSMGEPERALSDFREARRLISLLRTDIVRADNDRVAMESGGLSRVPAGLVEAGNRLARETGERKYLEETFEAAEQDRLWSLRALVPSQNDWRTRLPADYWDLLAQYQAAELAFLEKPSPQLRTRAASLGLELQHLEAAAQPDAVETTPDSSSILARSQRALDPDTVLFSFLLTARGGWMWAVDRNHAEVFPIPSLPALKGETAAFVRELREGSADAPENGQAIFRELFGAVPASYLSHKRWLLELDGPLYDLPFAALVTGIEGSGPVYLIERAALQAIPGALLTRGKETTAGDGSLLAVGDPVYNAADERFPQSSRKGTDLRRSAVLPRLPATAGELRECSRAWGPSNTRLLTGADASLPAVQRAIGGHHSVIHFATHVVAGPDEFSSGLIVLSLSPSGAMGLLGPTEIVAHPVTADLVVLNGCHSTQGRTLPAAGLMGLTRAWIGAGAGSVLATRWEIPDDAATTLIADFYRELRAEWARGPAFALQHAQLEFLKKPNARKDPSVLGSYFLLGRV